MAAVWVEEMAVEAVSADFRAILDALPIPVWLRDKGLALTWGNHAFLTSTGASDIAAARVSQVALDKTERDLAASARSQNSVLEAKRFAVIGGPVPKPAQNGVDRPSWLGDSVARQDTSG